MEKELFPKLNEPRFLVTVSDNPPVIMCEKHAQTFEKIMMVANIPCTIYELDEEDSDKKCHACSMLPDIVDNMPRIILPN